MHKKKIMVTGVSRGLGHALCHEFAELGHQVAGCARSSAAVSELQQTLGGTHQFAVVDLASDASVGQWVDDLVRDWGVPDLVINNAAIITENAPLWEVPIKDFEQLVAINVTGVFSVTRHVLPAMIVRGSGVIANLSSGWGRSVSADVAAYCTTKWAIEGMTQALAEDLPDGLAAVPVNPGVINTDMLQSCFGAAASDSPSPQSWVTRAAPFFLQLGPGDNGQQRSV